MRQHTIDEDSARRAPAAGSTKGPPRQRGTSHTSGGEGAGDGGEHTERIGRVALVQFQGTADHVDLPGVRLVVDAGAAAGDLGGVDAGEHRDQCRGHGGVGDAHLAGEQHLVARRDEVAGGLDAHLDGSQRLLAGQRGSGGEVGGPGPDLARHQAWRARQFAGHSDVHHAHLGAHLVGEGVADRAAAEEVGDHLGGDLLGPRRDPLGVHAVVAGEDRHRGGLRQRRRALPGQPAQLRGDDLQHAQGSGRLRHPLLPLPGLTERLGVQRADARQRLGQQVVRLGAGQHPASVGLLVHHPGQRAALRPAGLDELGLVGEGVHVPDAEVGDHLQVVGQAEFPHHLPLVEEADPADAEPFGTRGEPQVLHRERGRVGRHLRLGVAAERVAAAPGGVRGDDDVDRGVENGLDLQFLELLRPGLRQRLRVRLTLAGGQLVHGPPGLLRADDDEVPGLGVADAGSGVGRLQHP
ncbi:hypothetical protein GCM10028832_15230 [Streptomyces sparsus]